ncbi:MAG: cell division protein FtsZ [Bacteroidales bacterium]|nr:cell division protein FtsZ [Bacteroidales bacterium]
MDDILKFDFPLNQSAYIKVIGIGGGGSNAVNHMFEHGIQGVDFIVCNTDASALDGSPVPNKIQLGKGLGAGNMPSVAEKAAIEKAEEIKTLFENNTQMVFITAGMGGGTGTGAAPVVAKLLKEIELEDEEVKRILTVAVVTTPFSIEGRKRIQQAQEGIAELRKHVDAILIINNDKLKEYGEFKMSQAFALANEILTTAVKGISEIITVRSTVQIDFRDVNTVMQSSGVALMGCGSAEGEERAVKAVMQAISSPLLNDSNINGAKNVLIYISSSPENEVTMSEFEEITHFVQKTTGSDVDVIWGAGNDETLGEKISVTLIATGFSENELYKRERIIIDLEKGQIPTTKQQAMPFETLETPATSQFMYSLDDEWDDNRSVEKIHNPIEKTAEPNSLEASLISMEQRISAPAKTQVVNELPKDEPFLRFEKINTPTTAAPTLNAERFQAHSADRIQQLRDLSAKVKTAEGLEEIERVPAYMRRQVNLVEPVHSSTSEANRFNLTEDGHVVKNRFFNDNVD